MRCCRFLGGQGSYLRCQGLPCLFFLLELGTQIGQGLFLCISPLLPAQGGNLHRLQVRCQLVQALFDRGDVYRDLLLEVIIPLTNPLLQSPESGAADLPISQDSSNGRFSYVNSFESACLILGAVCETSCCFPPLQGRATCLALLLLDCTTREEPRVRGSLPWLCRSSEQRFTVPEDLPASLDAEPWSRDVVAGASPAERHGWRPGRGQVETWSNEC